MTGGSLNGLTQAVGLNDNAPGAVTKTDGA
jgi:hypothetical protein